MSLKELEKRLGIPFQNKVLLETAFTHSSYANERHVESNERLEFLGDAIVEIVVSEYLYHNFLQWSEGQLTKLRATLVCEQTLSTLAKDCDFPSYLRLGKGSLNLKDNNAVLCDVFEAFVGAVYLDRGMAVAKAFVLSQIQPLVTKKQAVEFVDYKTKLQEKQQRQGAVRIAYELLKEEGPAHDKWFEVSVSVNGVIKGYGQGKNKKSAEQQAAKEALKEE